MYDNLVLERILDRNDVPLDVKDIIREGITKYKREEEALRQSEDRLILFSETAPDGFVRYDSKLNLVDINKAGLEIFPAGTKKENIIGQNIAEISPNIKETGRYDKYLAVLKTGNPFFVDDLVPHPKFGDIHLSVKAFKVGDELGIIYSDITDYKKIEIALRESEEKYHNLFEHAGVGMFRTALDGSKVLAVNQKMCEIVGLSREELMTGSVIMRWANPEERIKMQRQLVEKGKIVDYQVHALTKDGAIITLLYTAKLYPEEGYLEGTAVDITERKKKTEELREAKGIYQDFYENAPDMYASVDPRTSTIIRCNQTLATYLGYTKEEIIGKGVFEIYHPDCMEDIQKAFQTFVKTGKVHGAELQLKRKDGTKIDVNINVSAVLDEQGNILYSRSALRDITDRKRSEGQLKYQANLIENVSDAIISTDLDFTIKSWNKAAEKIYGWKEEEVLGKILTKVVSTNYIDKQAEEVFRDFQRNGLWRGEVLHRRKDGTSIHILSSVSVFKDSSGTPIGAVGINHDITERKQIEDAWKMSESWYRNIFENSSVSLWVMDFSRVKDYFDHLRQSGVNDFSHYFEKHPEIVANCASMVDVDDVNQITLDLFQSRQKEEFLINYTKIFTEETYNGFMELLIGLAEGKTEFRLGTITQTLKGEKKHVLLRLSVSSGHEETLARVLVSIQDISELKRVEKALQQRTNDLGERVKEQTCLYKTSKLLQDTSLALEEIFQSILVLIPPAWQYPEITCARIIFQQEIHNSASFQESLWCQKTDIVIFGKKEGLLEVYYTDEKKTRFEGPFLKEERHLLDNLGRDMSGFIERKITGEELKQELRMRNRILQTFQRIPEISLDLQSNELAFQEIVKEISIASGFPIVAIELYNESKKKILLKAVHGVIFPQYIDGNLEIPFDASHIWTVATTGQPIIETKSSRNLLSSSPHVFEIGFQTFVGIPMIFKYRVIGVLILAHPQTVEVSKHLLQWITGLANHIASLIIFKRTEEKAINQRRLLNAINKVFREAIGCDTAKEVAQTCLAVAEEITDSKFGFIGELNQKGLFDTKAISNPGWNACKIPDSEATVLTENMPLRGIDRSVLKEGTSRIVNDLAFHPDLVGFPEGHPPVTSFLGVPLKRGTKTLGMIALANKEKGYEFTHQQDLETLSAAFMEALVHKQGEVALIQARNSLTKKVKLATRDLVAEKQRIETILETLPDGIIVIDPESEIYMANKVFKDYYTNMINEIFPSSLQEIKLLKNSLTDSIVSLFHSKTEESITIEPQIGLHLQLASTIARTSPNTSLGVIITVRDVTPFVELENMRKQFTSAVSHELRTPITAIKLTMNNLQNYWERLAEEERKEMISMTQKSIMVLTQIIEDILLSSRIEVGKISLNWKKFQLLEIVHDLLIQMEPQRLQKDIHIELDFNLEIQLFGDDKRISQVLRILIDNAIKYSNPKSIVKIKAIDNYQGKYNPNTSKGLLIQVIDSGIGIRAKDLQHMFTQFFRAEEVKEIQGTGLGLALANDLVTLHSGKIFVESDYGKGSTFSVFLPKLERPPEQ